jgi:probable rRNA maturation factor
MKIILINQAEKNKFKISEKQIQKLCDTVIQNLKSKKIKNIKDLKKTELTCVFLSKKEMQILNKSFRKKNKPTDVLSFQPLDNSSVGELVFCPSVLLPQSKKQKHSLSHEFMYMFIHGMLHLLGYDHEVSKKEEKIMFTLQDLVFQQLTDTELKLNYLSLKS